MYLFSLLITFIFIWNGIYDNGYYITPKNPHCLRTQEAKLISVKRRDAMQVIHSMPDFKTVPNTRRFERRNKKKNIVIANNRIREKKNCAKSGLYNLEPFLILPKIIRNCGFSLPSLISLLYNRMTKLCSVSTKWLKQIKTASDTETNTKTQTHTQRHTPRGKQDEMNE